MCSFNALVAELSIVFSLFDCGFLPHPIYFALSSHLLPYKKQLCTNRTSLSLWNVWKIFSSLSCIFKKIIIVVSLYEFIWSWTEENSKHYCYMYTFHLTSASNIHTSCNCKLLFLEQSSVCIFFLKQWLLGASILSAKTIAFLSCGKFSLQNMLQPSVKCFASTTWI